MKTAIIANPIAGNGRGHRRAEALEQALHKQGVDVALHLTTLAGEGQQIASATDADCVAVVGGDGTVNEVLNGLGDRQIRLAILAAGSVNVVARELGFPKDPDFLAQWIAHGASRPMDLLECGGRRVVLGGGAGFDAAVAARVKAIRGERLGLWRWVWPTLQTAMRYAYPKVRVVVDGVELCSASPYVVVGNCPYSAGRFRATPKAKTDDGLLDVIAVRSFSLPKMIVLAAASLAPSFTERKDVAYAQGRHVHLEPAEDVAAPLQLDGDPAGTIPADFEVRPNAINVVGCYRR